MSRENVELWRASIDDAFFPLTNEFDPEAAISRMAELWDPEVELDTSEAAALDIGDLYRGRGGAGQFWREWLAAWETMQFEYTMVDADDRVVMLVDMWMRGRSTGIEVPFGKFAWVGTFRDRLMVHAKLYMSQSEALEAAGLSE
jgi:SnoaL-like domain